MPQPWTRLALALAFLPGLAAADAPATAPGVTVPLPPAAVGTPPPGTRGCLVEFEGASDVSTDCPRPCYSEDWDGPVLLARNACERTIWVSHVFQLADGSSYRTPCYELPARTQLAIPEAALADAVRRQPIIGVTPGPGWPQSGFRVDCFPARTPVPTPTWWIDDRWDAHVHDGVLGEDAERPGFGPAD